MTTSDSILELEALRAAMARGDASQETRERFEKALAAIGWGAGETAQPPSASPAAAPVQPGLGMGFLGADTTGISVDVELHLTHVPLALVHAFTEDRDPIASVTVENHSPKGRRVRVRSWVEGFSAESVHTEELDANKNKKASVPILPTFFQDKLDDRHHPVRATLHVEVWELENKGGPRIEDHRTIRLWLLPRTTTVLWQKDAATGEGRDLTKHLASWVTPDDPEVMSVLRQSADRVPGGQVVSYQLASAQVEAQVKALFETLKARGLAYVNSTVATGGAGAFVQRIRLPAESLRTTSANCVDGAVLYASLIEAASLRSAIVVVPGHAFVAWRPKRTATATGFVFDDWTFLETTMTLSGTYEAARESAKQTFASANALKRATIHDVQALRAEGYLPIG